MVISAVMGMGILPARGAPVALNFILYEDIPDHTWMAYGQITGDTSRTSGLAGVRFDVGGTGGVTVTSSFEDMPRGGSISPFFLIGFVNSTSNGTNGVGIQGAQVTTYQSGTDSETGKNNILTGVGLVGQTQYALSWTQPVLLAHGTYTGSNGTLTIAGSTANTIFLPAVLPAPTPAGVEFMTFSPDSVTGQFTTAPPILTSPEPGSLGLLGLGALAALLRRRSPMVTVLHEAGTHAPGARRNRP
jgi:hypothetical protein